LADRCTHGDNVGERGEDVVVVKPVVLRGPLLPKELDHVDLPGVAKCFLAHRHPTVRDDHRCVAREAEQDQRHTHLPDVRKSEREQESV
jgi:hypothetical protein